jgi:Arc/MetJ-type ribon-helix-helix transcriptional regulator
MGTPVEEGLATGQPSPSETGQPVQEQGQRGVPTGTNPPATSGAGAQAQEQPTSGQRPAIDEAEIRRRVEQSERDKIRHQAMLDAQAAMKRQQEYEAEQRRLAEMDDEEFGQYTRQAQQEQARVFQIRQQVAQEQWATIHNQVLSTIDPDLRDELDQRGQRGEFTNYADFLKAAQEAQLQKRLAAELKKREKEIRDAVQKEYTAEGVENDPGPVTGSGTPTSRTKHMPNEQLISVGFAEALERQRRGRR